MNKLDRYGADPFLVLAQIRKKLGFACAATQVPSALGVVERFRLCMSLLERFR